MFGKKVITRFAPSPTGFLHVGNLRTALYNYLLAKKHHGKFLLRIEDTDQARKVEGAAENLQLILKKFGLTPDNNSKPLIQSARLAMYQVAAQKLIKETKAYYCFCTKDRLDQLKQEQEKNHQPPRYDRHCRNLSQSEIAAQLTTGTPHVVRFVMPDIGQTTFTDLIRGPVSFENSLIDDQIIIKSDGFPTYHLASVVDDHDMKVTHVIRGEDWLSSTPKHLLLYQALGYQPPKFAHLPLLLNADKSKLSKRQGDVTAEGFLSQGYLPEALLNFILLLGWNPGTDQEIFNLKEMINQFSLEKVNKSGAVFNVQKLDWLNGHYIRAAQAEKITELAIPYLIQSGMIKPEFKAADVNQNVTGYLGTTINQIYTTADNQAISGEQLAAIVDNHRDKLKKMSDIVAEVDYIFQDLPYQTDILLWKKTTPAVAMTNLVKLIELLNQVDPADWQAVTLEGKVKQFITANGFGNGDILFPMRAAITGKSTSPGPLVAAELLGKDKTLVRLSVAIEKLKKIE